ncbi:MAG: hypothetical protein NTV06_00700, partial [candidate division Zixibacteria bacterium]|nr:hypothetical protein [candidate division Zixibacteria bacterium]
MISRKLIIILLFFLIYLPNCSYAAILFPVGPPENQFIYEAIRREEIISGEFRLNHNVAPFNLKEIGIRHPLALFDKGLSYEKLSPFFSGSENFTSAKYERAKGYESIRGGYIARPTENLFVYSNFLLDEQMAKDPGYTGKKWRGLAGEIETAFISYSRNHLNILFGRFASNWGP